MATDKPCTADNEQAHSDLRVRYDRDQMSRSRRSAGVNERFAEDRADVTYCVGMALAMIFRRMTPVVVAAAAMALLTVPADAAIPPPPPEDVVATPGHRQVALSWTVPNDPDVEAVVVRRSQGLTPPADPAAGVGVYDGVGDGVVDSGLTNGITYSYSLWTRAVDDSYSTAPIERTVTPVPRTPATVGLHVDSKHVRYGHRVNLRARLAASSSGDGIGGERIELQARHGGSDPWRVVGARTTAANGRAEWTFRPDASNSYRVVHAASPTVSRAVSDSRRVEMTPLVTARLSNSWARQWGNVVVRGKVRPAFRGGAVILEKRVDGSWRRIARDHQNADGEYSIRVGSGAKRGTYHYRVVVPNTKAHRQATSERLSLDVVRVVTYQIERRGRIVASMEKFRKTVAKIYADQRGWSRAYVHFKRLKRGADFSVVLAQAEYVPRFAPICDAYWSCRVGRYVIINQDRWRFGTPYFLRTGATLAQYRAMVVNHETGHWFGLGHSTCAKRGALAPVMMQQSKGLHGCKPNPWPLPGEIARVR